MENLFEHCEGWENCENGNLKSLFENKMIKREEFKLPEGNELERLNKICIKCNHDLIIEEKKCPVCGNNDLQVPLFYMGEAASTKIYNYYCDKCRRNLYSLGKLD